MDDVNLQPLPWTGERYLPSVGGDIELEHIHRYLLAGKMTLGKRVLDIASGEGYGSALLSRSAKSVVGVDISEAAVAHAKIKYKADNLSYWHGSCAAIPLADHSVDVVVSFETIEHHEQHEEMMREIKRVLIPGGVLLISCPDKLEYSDKPGYDNPYHVKELYRDQFISLLNSYFNVHKIAGQRLMYGSAIFEEGGGSTISSYDMHDESLLSVPGVSRAVYLIAVASDADLPSIESGVLEQSITSSNAMQEVAQLIACLNRDKDIQLHENNNLEAKISALDVEISNLGAVIANQKNVVADLAISLSEQKASLQEIYLSHSWKLTAPLRAAIKFFR
jgi:SAM-dependent methyltransferase